MAVKKYKHIFNDLKWCEKKLLEWKNYVDNPENAFSRLEDRMAMKMTAKGTISMIAATKESQMESLRKTIKDVMELLEKINELREVEVREKEVQMINDEEVPDIMRE